MTELLFQSFLGTPVWFWLAFVLMVAALTAFDLGLLHKEDRVMGIGESLKLSAFYISIALAFGAWVWAEKGADLGMKYFTGFFIEKALSIDNIFVISLIFTFFAIPAKYQYRALLWGIIGVIVLRGLMIAAGAALVSEAYWVLYLFAAFLIVTGIKMFFTTESEPDLANNAAIRWISRRMRVTKELHGDRFFVTRPDERTGRMVRAATPLFLALVVINLADLVFAVELGAGDLRHHHRHVRGLHLEHHGGAGPARALLRAVGHDRPLPLPQARARGGAGLHRLQDLRLGLPPGRREVPARRQPRRHLRPDRRRHRLVAVEDAGGGGDAVRDAPYSRVRLCRGETARPRNTIAAWLRRTKSSSSRRPILSRTFDLGTVVILSTISRDGERRPLRSFGSTISRNSGASVGSVVNAQTVMESVASNVSSCTMTTGRGLLA